MQPLLQTSPFLHQLGPGMLCTAQCPPSGAEPCLQPLCRSLSPLNPCRVGTTVPSPPLHSPLCHL